MRVKGGDIVTTFIRVRWRRENIKNLLVLLISHHRQTVHYDHFVGIKLIHNLLCSSKRHKVSRVVFFGHQKTPSIWSSLIICVRYGDNIQLICKPMFCPQPAAILSKCSMNDDVHKIIAQKNSVPCVWLNWPFITYCVVCHIFGCC